MIVTDMPFSIISIIEPVVIAILSLVIIEYEIDRRRLKREMRRVYQNMGFRISAQIERTFKYANTVRYKLSNELYIGSLKKNTIVKEVCNAFYEAIKARFENHH